MRQFIAQDKLKIAQVGQFLSACRQILEATYQISIGYVFCTEMSNLNKQ